MVPSRRVIVSAVITGLSIAGAAGGRAQQERPASAAAAATAPAVATEAIAERFVGGWDYNAQDSVNAATGRPEQNPRSATQRAAGTAGGTRSGGSSTGGGQPPVGATMPAPRMPVDPMDPNSRGRSPNTFGPSPLVLAEARTLVRDLFEVNEKLTIAIAADAVTFTDDLKRERSYPTDGKKRKYRLGAAAFEARVYWDGAQLKKDIEGAYGFRMSETYFVGDDSRRLFIIIRLGDQTKKPPPPISGANRVYDRIDTLPPSGGTSR